jgi:hypothetical protein
VGQEVYVTDNPSLATLDDLGASLTSVGSYLGAHARDCSACTTHFLPPGRVSHACTCSPCFCCLLATHHAAHAGGNIFIRNNAALADIGPLALAGPNLAVSGRVVVEANSARLPEAQVQALVSRGRQD